MIAEDVLVTDTAEPDAKPEAAKQQNNEAGTFLDELARSQSRKKLDLLSEIEICIKTLETHISQRLDSFLQLDSHLSFEEMALFEGVDQMSRTFASHSMFLSEIDETVVGCVVLENAVSRKLMSAALTGKVPPEKSDKEFSPAERKVFLVFGSLLNTALNESFDSLSILGVPKKAAFVEPERFEEIAGERDWVCLTFCLEFLDHTEKLLIVVPLSLLSGEFPEKAEAGNDNELVIDAGWQSSLFDHIEKLKVPLFVEFGSKDLPLSQVNNLQPGQRIELSIDETNLKVFTEEGQALLLGGLERKGDTLEIKVIEKVE